MKTITNKKTEIMNSSENPIVEFTYAGLLKVVINQPPKEGFSVSEMRDRLRIWGILDTADLEKKDIVLEDADFKIVKTRFDAFKWAAAHQNLIDLADHLEDLTKKQ